MLAVIGTDMQRTPKSDSHVRTGCFAHPKETLSYQNYSGYSARLGYWSVVVTCLGFLTSPADDLKPTLPQKHPNLR